MRTSTPGRWDPRVLVAAFAVASSIVRLYLAHRYSGFQTGDDLEVAEAAFRRAIGLVHEPWNIRSLLIPDLVVAPFVASFHALGIHDHAALASLARVPFILLSALNVALVFMLGRRWYGDTAGVVASGLYSAHWIPLVYGSSLYPRVAAISCVLVAAILLHQKSVPRAALAGTLAALAVTTRYSEVIFVLSLMVLISEDGRETRGRRLAALMGGFLLGLLVFVGLYDRVTWGQWFGSLREFAELVFVRRDASSAVVSHPAWWYAGHLLHWVPLTLLPFLVVAMRRGEWRRLLAFVILPVLLLSAIFHKELRYLQVVIPFLSLVAAQGFVLWSRQPGRRRLAIVLLALSIPFALGRLGVAARRSTNAVDAAQWIAGLAPPAVALSQAWAYGGRLFLGNDVDVADLGVPADPAILRRLSPALSVVAVYSSDANDALRQACRERGLSEVRTFAGRGGRAVTVFSRSAGR